MGRPQFEFIFCVLCLLAPGMRVAAQAVPQTPTPESRPNPEPSLDGTPAQAPIAADGVPVAARTTSGVTELREELARVMDELMAARARAAILTKALFHTPLSVRVVRRADAQRLEHVTLRLDGIPVHDSDGAAIAHHGAELFEGFVAPGVHDLAIEVEEVARDGANYRYMRHERFRFEIKKGMRTQVEIVMRDNSDMAVELPEDDEGEYKVSTVLRVTAEPVKAR